MFKHTISDVGDIQKDYEEAKNMVMGVLARSICHGLKTVLPERQVNFAWMHYLPHLRRRWLTWPFFVHGSWL